MHQAMENPKQTNKKNKAILGFMELRLWERGSQQAEDQMMFSAGQGDEVAGWGGGRSLGPSPR